MSFFIPIQKYRHLMAAYILGKPLCPPWSCAVISMWSTNDLGMTMGLNSLPIGSTIFLLRMPFSMAILFGGKPPTCSHCKMLFILVSLACSELIDLDFKGRVRSTSLKNVSRSGLILTPSTMISPTLIVWQFFEKIITKLGTWWFSR